MRETGWPNVTHCWVAIYIWISTHKSLHMSKSPNPVLWLYTYLYIFFFCNSFAGFLFLHFFKIHIHMHIVFHQLLLIGSTMYNTGTHPPPYKVMNLDVQPYSRDILPYKPFLLYSGAKHIPLTNYLAKWLSQTLLVSTKLMWHLQLFWGERRNHLNYSMESNMRQNYLVDKI